jgi:hypothetical protein
MRSGLTPGITRRGGPLLLMTSSVPAVGCMPLLDFSRPLNLRNRRFLPRPTTLTVLSHTFIFQYSKLLAEHRASAHLLYGYDAKK